MKKKLALLVVGCLMVSLFATMLDNLKTGGVDILIQLADGSEISPALDLVEQGASRHGETIELQHLGILRRATIAAPCAFDPEGRRLHA